METFRKDKWFADKVVPQRIIMHEIKEELLKGETKYQKYRVFSSDTFGKVLVLDNDLQSCELDEYIYHETLVHPALLSHPDPEKVLIIGGGEGATLRECVKHKNLKKVVMVDIDEELVNICKKHLPEWSLNAFSDERAVEVYDDAKKYIKDSDETYDVVISDLTEPVPDSPARFLLTREFFQFIKSRLNNGGVFVMQASVASIRDNYFHSVLYSTLSKVFPIVRSFGVYVPSFCARWGFILASDKVDPLEISEKQLIDKIKKRINGKLEFYDFNAHKYIFSLYKPLKSALDSQNQILTDKDTSAIGKIFR